MLKFLISFIPGVGPVLAWLEGNKTARAVLFGLLIVLALAALLWGTHHAGVMAERRRAAIAAAQAQAEAETKAAAAAVIAARQSQTDAAAVAAKTESLKHADDAQPDAVPNAKSRAFNCERLRRAGVKAPAVDCPG